MFEAWLWAMLDVQQEARKMMKNTASQQKVQHTKIEEAQVVIRRCLGKKGLWASPYRYRHQCWTRDFAYAGQRYLLENGNVSLAQQHINQLTRRQRFDGRIPIMYLDNTVRWLAGKVRNSITSGRISFLLKRYFMGDGVEFLSPWTKDSEILYVAAVGEYIAATGDTTLLDERFSTVRLAMGHIENKLTQGGLVHGADWRDTRTDLDNVATLTNNCWLYHAYKLLSVIGNDGTDLTSMLRERINRYFWTGTHYKDYIGNVQARTPSDAFDTFGNALAILFGIANEDQAHSIFNVAESLSTPFGYRLNSVTLPPKNTEEANLMGRISHTGVIWPFIHGHMILAALKIGLTDLAKKEFAKWNLLPGFYEYYDPETGAGHGSVDQMWSAATYLRVAQALETI